jgi:segregation and condensation protein B
VAGGYQITTRPEYHERISRLFESKPPSRLSLQALETLAVIAYRQPITVPEIMALRGLHSAGVVRTLLEKKLIRIMGRKKVVGRPLLYGTTREFQIRFGLKGLDELPNLADMAEVFGEEIASQLGEVMRETEAAGGGGEDEASAPVADRADHPSTETPEEN